MKELCFYGADRSIVTNSNQTPQELLDDFATDLSRETYLSLSVILTYQRQCCLIQTRRSISKTEKSPTFAIMGVVLNTVICIFYAYGLDHLHVYYE